MSQQVLLGAIAIATGALGGVGLFVPFVAISYRRHGRLRVGRLLTWAAALVYFWAIWAYTLLPLPDPAAVRCAGTNLDPLAFVDDIREALAAPGNPLLHPAMMQLALNVLLFVPLGFFLRVLGGRGILTALLVGLGVSLVIETTQLTGVWGLYPCAYRVFDVDDLMTNTLGAVAGSLIALAVPRRMRQTGASSQAGLPRPVTRGRRVLAAVCDLLAAFLAQSAVAVAVQLVLTAQGEHEAVRDGGIAGAVSAWAVIAVWLVSVLASGRTPGDIVVELRYHGGPLPVPLARLLRFAGGIGGYMLLYLLPGRWSALLIVFVIVAVVLVFTTRDGRGLPGVLSGQRLDDARAPVSHSRA